MPKKYAYNDIELTAQECLKVGLELAQQAVASPDNGKLRSEALEWLSIGEKIKAGAGQYTGGL